MYACICACVHVRICIYVCLCICMHTHLYTSMRVWGGGLEVGFVAACSWFALVTGVGGYVFAGVEIRVLSCIFLYFRGC